jgi:hypothetical protein
VLVQGAAEQGGRQAGQVAALLHSRCLSSPISPYICNERSSDQVNCLPLLLLAAAAGCCQAHARDVRHQVDCV